VSHLTFLSKFALLVFRAAIALPLFMNEAGLSASEILQNTKSQIAAHAFNLICPSFRLTPKCFRCEVPPAIENAPERGVLSAFAHCRNAHPAICRFQPVRSALRYFCQALEHSRFSVVRKMLVALLRFFWIFMLIRLIC
jgi:hypothetical protein